MTCPSLRSGPGSANGDDHVTVLRMLADRHHDLTALRTQAVRRLHALLANLSAGGLSGRLSAPRAAGLLRCIRSADAVVVERRHQALDLLADVRRLDSDVVGLKARITAGVG